MNATSEPSRDTRRSLSQPPVFTALADRILDSGAPADVSYHGEIRAVRRPVRGLHVFEDRARRAGRQRHARQGPGAHVRAGKVVVDANRDFARRRDRVQDRAAEAQGRDPGLSAFFEKISSGSPSHAAEYTIVCPSGAKRALRTVPRLNVIWR